MFCVFQFFEALKIYTNNTTVEVRLVGEGVKPKLLLDPSDTYLDVGDALVSDSMYQTLKVEKSSSFSFLPFCLLCLFFGLFVFLHFCAY